MTSVYDTTKALWHWDRLVDLQGGSQPPPVHVQIILSDYCNHNCSFCAYRMDGNLSNTLFQVDKGQTRKARNPNRMIETEKAIEIIDDCVDMGVECVQFTGGGEPCVHPDFVYIASYAINRGLEVGLVTNGSMLLEESFRDVVRRMTWIRISVDASNPKTYCGLREVGMGMWHRVEDGVQLLCAEKKASNLPLVIGCGFVATPENWGEMSDAADLYRSWGADNVRLGVMFNPDGYEPYKEIAAAMIEEADLAVTESNNPPNFTVISRVKEKLEELKQGPPECMTCWYQNFTTYIGADLNLYRCCVYAYHPRGVIGSLKDQRFVELWESQKKESDFNGFNAHGCARCQFNMINKQIDSALRFESAPEHRNFV